MDWDVGATGLALFAYSVAAFTQSKGEFKRVIGKGIAWLSRKQRRDGSLGWNTFDEQGIATVALSELYGLTMDRKLASVAQQGADCIAAIQPSHGGFCSAGAAKRNEGEIRTTSWQTLALKSAYTSGCKVPERAFTRCRRFLRSVSRANGTCAERARDAAATPGATAAAMICRSVLGVHRADELNRRAAEYLIAHEKRGGGPGKEKNRLVGDLYYTCHAQLGFLGLSSENQHMWDGFYRAQLEKAQVTQEADERGRYVRGSWDPAGHDRGGDLGRAYCTAMAACTLFGPSYRNHPSSPQPPGQRPSPAER